MIRPIVLLTFVILFISCQETNPCAVGPGERYIFPQLSKNSTRTREEVNQFFDLPEDVSKCMSTESLVETCLAYPQLGLINAGSNPQVGYNLVSSIFRGLRELAVRSDRGEHMLRKYKMIDPAGYDPNGESISIGRYVLQISYVEIILSQEETLKSLSLTQKIELVERAREVYQRKVDDITNYGLYNLATTPTILARLMRIDQYQPFLNMYDPKVQSWNFVGQYWPTDYTTMQTVFSVSSNYLNFLKQQR